jgi:hypothetical protein
MDIQLLVIGIGLYLSTYILVGLGELFKSYFVRGTLMLFDLVLSLVAYGIVIYAFENKVVGFISVLFYALLSSVIWKRFQKETGWHPYGIDLTRNL